MKKKVIIIVSIIIVVLILLVPVPFVLRDGGTVEYKALLYKVSDIHRLTIMEENKHEEGIIIEVLGIEIYNNVK